MNILVLIFISVFHRRCWLAPRHVVCRLQCSQRSEKQSCWMPQRKDRSDMSKSVTVAVCKDGTVAMMRLFWSCCQNQAAHSVNQVICQLYTYFKSNGGLSETILPSHCDAEGPRVCLKLWRKALGRSCLRFEACRRRFIETLRAETRWKGPKKDHFFRIPAIQRIIRG